MRRGGFARPGASAYGPRLVAALVAGALMTGCGASAPGDASGGRTGAASPSPEATSEEELCARLVGHWARRALDNRTYGDYQSMGLSHGQYDILRAAVDAARPVRERRGGDAAHEVMDRRIRTGCAEWYRRGGPSKGPWQ
ncbi:hypothetical protein [Streptomyces sp. NPDC007904]|jgi:hypothetical protein|uniref:hypothetical protein n=1 Tax=Streptomyces sp. NPDC007904 TaxID=3364787 RepID=UPI0036E459E2